MTIDKKRIRIQLKQILKNYEKQDLEEWYNEAQERVYDGRSDLEVGSHFCKSGHAELIFIK